MKKIILILLIAMLGACSQPLDKLGKEYYKAKVIGKARNGFPHYYMTFLFPDSTAKTVRVHPSLYSMSIGDIIE
jgi:hypothetical protein